MLGGIDVSGNQGGIDFGQAASSGQVKWVYAKASEGITYNDDHFRLYHDACKANGIPFGPYHFLRFNDIDTPQKQAQHFLQVINGYEGQLLPMVDIEVTDGKSAEVLAGIIAGFLGEVEKTLNKKKVLLYTYYSFWGGPMGGSAAFADHPLWIAEYNSDATPTLPEGFTDWTIWQWSSSGNIPGIGTSVDLDRLNGDDLAAITR
jgi:lysozyme